MSKGAMILRPGVPAHLGEAAALTLALAEFYGELATISDGFIEGGDILTTDSEFLVGGSARTDAAGIAELARLVAPWGHRVREVDARGSAAFQDRLFADGRQDHPCHPAPRGIGLFRGLPGDPDR